MERAPDRRTASRYRLQVNLPSPLSPDTLVLDFSVPPPRPRHVPSCLFTCFIVYQVTDDSSRWWAGDNDICLLGTVHWGYRGPDRAPSSPHPISAPAKCTQLLVSIKHKQPKDQDTEGFQKVLHFGSVAVGCTMERQIRLYNPSVVCMYWEGMGKREGAGIRDPKSRYAYDPPS